MARRRHFRSVLAHALFLAVAGIALIQSFTLVHADFGATVVDDEAPIDILGGADEGYEDLLHWAIEHSDPSKLAAQAEEAQRREIVKDLKEQRQRVKELLDHMRAQPTETDMMKEAVGILRRDGASDTELVAGLQALQILVEPIDNANDLPTLGGLAPVVALLERGPELAAAAAHVLGTAASNNPRFQRNLLEQHPAAVRTLLQVASAAEPECGVKGMYALAALVRNLPQARAAFADADGFRTLEALLRGESTSARVKRKALSLFMDLVDTQPAAEGGEGGAEGAQPGGGGAGGGGSGGGAEDLHMHRIRLGEEAAGGADSGAMEQGASGEAAGGATRLAAAAVGTGLAEAVVQLLAQPDLDTQEKALVVMQRLAGDAVAAQALNAHGAGAALALLLQQLVADAPAPGEEADPYNEYLQKTAQQVAQQLQHAAARHQQAGQQGGQGQQGGAGAGVRAGLGADARAEGAGASGQGEGRARSAGRRREAREQQEGAGQQQEVLALGGPAPARGVCAGTEHCEL